MKARTDPRHLKRRETIASLFAYIFHKDQPISPAAKEVIKNLSTIDGEITISAPEWPLARINRIDQAILRLAIYEMVIQKTQPPKVIIDEAVELAKEFGSENSSSFINGVLGNVFKRYYEQNE